MTLYRVVIIVYLQQTMFLGYIVMQPLCIVNFSNI